MPASSVASAIMAETEPVIKSVEAAMKGLAAGTGAALGAVAAAKAEPQDDGGKVDLIALNKEIRREHRNTMKDKGIGVTVKAPGNPILLDVDRSLLHKVVSNIFDNIVQYTADNTRVYIEMYVQSNKVIYVVKNTVREDALAEAEAIVKGGIGTVSYTHLDVYKRQATFIIKMLAAFAGGLIFHRMVNNKKRSKNSYFALIVAGIAGGVAVTGGYFIYESILYGAAASGANAIFNVFQNIVGIVAAFVLDVYKRQLFNYAGASYN